MPKSKIGFIGAGHMSRAIIDGLLTSDSGITPAQIMASARSTSTANANYTQFGIATTTDNQSVCDFADYLIIGVKPQQMHELLLEISEYDLADKILITLAAGIRLEDYRKILGDDITLVRTMPNIAAARQAALTGIYTDAELSEAEETTIDGIFSAIGSTAWLDDETQIDGITALSGSGIAYFYRLMQAMAKAGERYGFEADELYDIISLTALGASTLALESDNEKQTSFTDFVDKIAVKGGTTAEAINVFNQADIDAITEEAMQAVVNKSRALGDSLTEDW